MANFAFKGEGVYDHDKQMNPVHVYETMIRESHLDTFGHVNNARYLDLFEEARWDMISERGFGLDVIRETQTGPVVLRSDLIYRRELKNRETIRIETQLEVYEGLVGKLRQQMFKPDGKLACNALFEIAMWDLRTRKLMRPSDAFLHSVLGADAESIRE